MIKAKAATNNVFASAADAMGAGIDALFAQNDEPEFMVNLDEVEIVEQVRDQMEDDEQDLESLGESLAKYQIQAILLRMMPAGHPKPYRLIAGERRYRAAELKGLPQLRAKAREMTDEEAEDFQFAENVHRKNLTQIEEAKKIQRDLDRLGSVDALLAKYQKSRAWLSKILSLLNLSEQAKRLVTENVSADVEVINTVKIVEKVDPAKARALVDDLKKTRGKENARDKAGAVKEEVKPSKKVKDRSQEEPGAVRVFADAKNDAAAVGKRRMTEVEFVAVRPLLNISEDRIEAARSALVLGETLQVVGDRYGWSRQAVGDAVNAVWRTLESYRESQLASANADALLPPGWQQVTLIAPTYLIDKFRAEIALASPKPVMNK